MSFLKNFELKNGLIILWLTVPVMIIDQITKVWALALKSTEPIVVVPNFWEFVYAENRGALWGIGNQLPEMERKLVFIGFSGLVTLVIAALIFHKEQNRLTRAIYALVLGGALGNLYDRIFRGFVVDFIDWRAGTLYHHPTFNIADVAIVVAVGLLIIEAIRSSRKTKA